MNAKNCSWSPEEDERLIQAHRIHGNRWTAIANIFGDRTDNAVKNRWAALVRKQPRLAEDEGTGGGIDLGQPAAKRQRLGEMQPSSGAFQPYATLQQSSYGPSMIGHYNGQPVTSMPTPFDQQLLLQPPQQGQHLASVQRVQPLSQHHMQHHLQQQAQHEVVAPLSIVVNKEFLNPWEMTLVQQINQAQAPVHIEVQERPTATAGPDVTAELVTKRSSWRQFVDSLDEPANQMSDILAWFNNASAGGQLQTATGRRLTRSLSKLVTGNADSLTEDHRSLLVRLMSKGLEYRTVSEQAEANLLGAAAAAAATGAAGAAGGNGGGHGGGVAGSTSAAAPVAAPAGNAAQGSHRADPLRRTRSSRKSQELEGEVAAAAAAMAAPGGPAAGQSAADRILNSGFPGFSERERGAAQPAGPVPGAPLQHAAGGLMARRASYRLQGGLPVSQPSMGDPFGDVLLTPTFTSQEIAMLIEALTPGAMGAKAH
ncbi:hypothetical protein N2152v2_003517 [Parachlorella kessleri]